MNPSNPSGSLGEIQLPSAVAAWTNGIVYVFLGLILLWIVLKIIGFFMRRAYNLTQAETASSKNLKPDFLKVDHDQRKELIERGKQFDLAYQPPVQKAVTATRFGVIISALITFGSATFFALGRIEDYDETWRKLTTAHKFGAILKSHPIGFVVAILIIIGGVTQLVMALRKKK
jgi:Na+-transporting methylmalonyl-CoA/oxaloacetate decarboxylase gamma subunit